MIIEAPRGKHYPALRSLWKEAFGDTDEFLNSFAQTAFSPERCLCVTVDGEAVAALYWFDCSYQEQRIAYLYAVATAKAYRGRGICSALMQYTHMYLKSLGYNGTVLVPGSKSLFEFYEKLGYCLCSCIDTFVCFASGDKAELRQIDKNEYTTLRRLFLPSNGIVQENENIDFLQTQAMFYTGDGFLLAAKNESDIFYGVELLGNKYVAPRILQSLGHSEGRFRVPGSKTPFAMYRSLEEKTAVLPSYFGLAFD